MRSKSCQLDAKRLFVGIAALTIFAGCASNNSDPIQQTMVITDGRAKPTVDPQKVAGKEVHIQRTMSKQRLLKTEFLYGADVQYSSVSDPKFSVVIQSLAVGHVPAHFRIVDRELQLVADNKLLSPSDVNHPEQVISRFEILAENGDELKISGADSNIYIAQVFGATSADKQTNLTDPSAAKPKDHWIRSAGFDANGNYILQESSIQMPTGEIVEFMESIFPRENLKPGADFEVIRLNDPESGPGTTDTFLQRFRLLFNQGVFENEKLVAYAQHYDLSKTDSNPKGEIAWYVTPNIPEDQIAQIQTAVEGWNRYFRVMTGIARDVMSFKGRLPAGIHLGDPRYNVINWDARTVAGAAYETQASDPTTGKMSHSLIYMPAAWLKIGRDFWSKGQFTDKVKVESPRQLMQSAGLTQRVKLNCARELTGEVLSPSLALSNEGLSSTDLFARELLKQTLFHEVGHSLGLAHNFKGSLSYDLSLPKASRIFSTSIMDYNQYEIERSAFESVGSEKGPLLEYDRQALSVLYNHHVDLRPNDPSLPVCDDQEADNLDGGVDPLCIRYDVEKDPTHAITTALDRISFSVKPLDTTLSETLLSVPTKVLSPELLAQVTTEEDAKNALSKVVASLLATYDWYYYAGRSSIAYSVRLNTKSLFNFLPESLLSGYSEAEMRTRAFDGVKQIMAITEVAGVSKGAFKKAVDEALQKLMSTEFGKALGAKQKAYTEDLRSKIDTKFKTYQADLMSKVRVMVTKSLAFKKAPMYLGKLPAGSVDTQQQVLKWLVEGALNTSHTLSERTANVEALATYRGRYLADPMIGNTIELLQKEWRGSQDSEFRDTLEQFMSKLKPQPQPPPTK